MYVHPAESQSTKPTYSGTGVHPTVTCKGRKRHCGQNGEAENRLE